MEPLEPQTPSSALFVSPVDFRRDGDNRALPNDADAFFGFGLMAEALPGSSHGSEPPSLFGVPGFPYFGDGLMDHQPGARDAHDSATFVGLNFGQGSGSGGGASAGVAIAARDGGGAVGPSGRTALNGPVGGSGGAHPAPPARFSGAPLQPYPSQPLHSHSASPGFPLALRGERDRGDRPPAALGERSRGGHSGGVPGPLPAADVRVGVGPAGHPGPSGAAVPVAGGVATLMPGHPPFTMAYEAQLDVVRSKMLPFLRFYSVSLSPSSVPRYLRAVLEVEGCPFCLHTEVLGPKPLVSITCVDEGCHHACHLDCVATAAWSVVLTPSHTPLRMCHAPVRSPRVTVLPKPAGASVGASPTPAPPSPRFAIEVSLLHAMSSGRFLTYTADDAVSLRDPVSGTLFLHTLAETADESTPLDDSDHLPRMSCLPAPAPGDGPRRFSHTRGRVFVSVREKGTDKCWDLLDLFDLKMVMAKAPAVPPPAPPAAVAGAPTATQGPTPGSGVPSPSASTAAAAAASVAGGGAAAAAAASVAGAAGLESPAPLAAATPTSTPTFTPMATTGDAGDGKAFPAAPTPPDGGPVGGPLMSPRLSPLQLVLEDGLTGVRVSIRINRTRAHGHPGAAGTHHSSLSSTSASGSGSRSPAEFASHVSSSSPSPGTRSRAESANSLEVCGSARFPVVKLGWAGLACGVVR
jgi:hypothetical protein